MISPRVEVRDADEILVRAKRLLDSQGMPGRGVLSNPSDRAHVVRHCLPGFDIHLFEFWGGDIYVKIGIYVAFKWCDPITWVDPELRSELLKRLTALMVLDDIASA